MNKKILVLIVVVLFLVALTLVGVFAFKITDIEITQVKTINEVDIKGIQEYIDKNIGKNILFFNETVFKKNLEEEFKNIKVVDTKRQFPNVLQVFIEEREEVFAIESNGKYYVLDKYLNVLREQTGYRNSNDIKDSTASKNLVLIENLTNEDIGNIEVGKEFKINNGSKQKALKEIANAFFGPNRLKDYNDTQKIMSIFYSIDLKNIKNLKMYTKNGLEERALEIQFTSDANDLLYQLQVVLGTYNSLEMSNKTKGKLIVLYDKQGKSYYVINQTEKVEIE